MKARPVTRGHGYLENYLAKRRAQKANALIPESLKCGAILDIGSGFSPHFLMQCGFSQRYGLEHGIDENYRAKMLREKNISLIDADIDRDRVPFDDYFFNVVTMLAVIEHIEPENVSRLFSDILRVLKPRGIFIVTTPAKWTKTLLHFLASINMVSKTEIDDHKGAYNRSEIIYFLKESGFSRQLTRTGYFECGMNIWAVAIKT